MPGSGVGEAAGASGESKVNTGSIILFRITGLPSTRRTSGRAAKADATSPSAFTHRMTAPESRYGRARLIAVADSVLVAYDYPGEHPIHVPDDWRSAMEAYEGRSLSG